MANKIIHADIMSHMNAADKDGDHYEGNSKIHTYAYFAKGNSRHGGQKLMDHLKSKGWTVSNHTKYDTALTGEGEDDGETHRYQVRKGDHKLNIHHAIAAHEPGMGRYHDIDTNSGPHPSIEKMKSIPTFAQYLQKTGGDKDLAHAAGLMPKNKMN